MTLNPCRDNTCIGTSAYGALRSSRVPIGNSIQIVAVSRLEPTTLIANTEDEMQSILVMLNDRTSVHAAGTVEPAQVSTESVAAAVMEIRRQSGLTWQELADLFCISRRSIHHWANGKSVTSSNEHKVRRMLSAMRVLDRGNQRETRSLLLAEDQITGQRRFDRLKAGHFDEATRHVESAQRSASRQKSISRAASNARRPPSPIFLLGAKQDRPDIPANARVVRAKRISEKIG